jgi:ketosteroid isomerase-like protein
MPSTAPADVARAVAAGVSRLVASRLAPAEREDQLDALAALYAERTDVRHPFAPLGDRPLRSRTELREHFAAANALTTGVERFEPVDTVVHETGDPETVVVEFTYEGVATGGEFSIPCIFVMRVRDGEIVESRDYGHHLALARAFGRLDTVLDALRGPATGGLAWRLHAAFNALDLAAVDDLFAVDFYSHPLQLRGRDAVKARWSALRVAAPELRTEVIGELEQGDRLLVWSRPSDGSGDVVELLRIADGRVSELWGLRGG